MKNYEGGVNESEGLVSDVNENNSFLTSIFLYIKQNNRKLK